MHKHITDTDNFFDQTWLVINTLQNGKGMSFVPASKMVEFYMRMLEDCKLPLATPISNPKLPQVWMWLLSAICHKVGC